MSCSNVSIYTMCLRKMHRNTLFNSRGICKFNGVPIDVRCILFIISSFQYRREHGISAGKIGSSFNDDDCVLRV